VPLVKHSERSPEATTKRDVFGWWPDLTFPSWGPLSELFRLEESRKMFPLEEFNEDSTFVVRAELPGIDPAKDVEVAIHDGMLEINAVRSEESVTEERHFHRREMRYGSFARMISLPKGVDESSVVASYKDGILEVRLPMHADEQKPARRIPVTRD